MKANKTFPWIIMFAIGLISAAGLGSSMVLMGSFLTPISQAMHTSIVTVSYYYTILVLVMAIMTPMIPNILAKVNNRLIYLIASIAITASLFLIGHFSSIWMFFIIAVIIGIAVSFLAFVPVGIIINNWFVKKTNFAIGLCWAITSVYQGIMSPVLANLISNLGWHAALNILATIVGILSIPFSLLIVFSPEKAGMKPYGYQANAKATTVEQVNSSESVSVKAIFASPAFWILMIMLCFFQFPAVLNQMFPTYAITTGFKGTVGGFMVTSAMIFDIFLNPLIGATCDKIGAEKGSILWLLLAIISYIILIFATNTHAAGLAIFGAGINDVVYTFLGTGITALAASILGKRAFDKGFSYVTAVSSIIGAFAMPLNNFITIQFKGFNSLFIFFMILIIINIILVAIGDKNHFDKTVA